MIQENLVNALKELSVFEPMKFKALAYKRAANTIFNIPKEDFDKIEDYTIYDGIGSSINKKIFEFIYTGKIEKLETLRKENSDKLDPMLYKIRKSFITKRISLEAADKLFETEIKQYIGTSFPISLAGSYRRRASYIADLDILVLNTKSHSSEEQLKAIVKLLDMNPNLEKLVEGDMKVSYKIKNSENTQIDLTACKPETEPFAIMHFTGPKEFNIKCRNIAKKNGYTLSQNGLNPIPNVWHKPLTLFDSEISIISWLGIDMQYVNPANR